MVKDLALALALVFAVLGAYLLAQRETPRTPGLPIVLSGGDFGFQPDVPPDPAATKRGWISGKFVVKVGGRWIEARPGAGIEPARK